MLIESIIKRAGGTKVDIEDSTYHFKPTPNDERHLAEVLIKAHAERFLSISEGFRYVGEEQLAGTTAAPVDNRMPRTSSTHAAFFDVGDKTITLQQLTIHAQAESGLDVEEWNAQDDQELYEQLDTALQELRDQAEVEAEAARNNQAPQRGAVLQPEPEGGHSDDEEDEAERLALEAALAKQEGSKDDGAEPTAEQREQAARETAEADERIKAEQKDEQGDKDEVKPVLDSDSQVANENTEQAAKLPSHDELVAAYKEKMGRAPSSRLSDERIYQLLQEDAE